MGEDQGPVYFDVLEQCLQFDVEASDFYGSGKGIHRYLGIVFMPCSWRLQAAAEQDDRLTALSGEPVNPSILAGPPLASSKAIRSAARRVACGAERRCWR